MASASNSKKESVKFEDPNIFWKFNRNPDLYKKYRDIVIHNLGRNSNKHINNTKLLFALELLISNFLYQRSNGGILYEMLVFFLIPFFANSLYGIQNTWDSVYNSEFPDELYGEPFQFLTFNQVADLDIQKGWAPDDLKSNQYYQFFVNSLIMKDYSSNAATNSRNKSNPSLVSANNRDRAGIKAYSKLYPTLVNLARKLEYFLEQERMASSVSTGSQSRSSTQKKRASNKSASAKPKPGTKKKPAKKGTNQTSKNKLDVGTSANQFTALTNNELSGSNAANNELSGSIALDPRRPGIQG